ncbi:lipopolysaccharide biosynthesis protein [sulfur-oxidizing endosymbiont of Gigantopelta aegis]|uniref:lipopolysaccharide biosynthesis protein n=1 Tax=sulfur-oxidizing endosymbiont of Gigantopelta aegis TaxID=2794934 RepID=UPI0018DD4CB4|nr:lipopolysaccharide biosynthesis protein [sulfur-oxidizing endosymbiont of Gigantopelta aegis]
MTALKKLASGVGWGTASIIVNTIFQLFFMAIMARLLDPADFGLIAIANVSLRFYSYFSQAGIAPALIQKKSLDEGDTSAALAISLGISCFFYLIAYLASPWTEDYFEMQGLGLVMQVLALNFIILGFSSISQALLRRESRFKAISIIEIISYVLGYGVTGVIAAYLGAGVWSLVLAFMTQSTVTALLSYFVIRYPITFKHTKAQRKSLLGYGVRYSFIGFIEFLTSNLAPLVIGKLLGASPAGFYSRAQLLAHLPVQHPTNILTRTLFPIMSSINDKNSKLLISFQLSSLIVGCYACAVGIGMHFAAADIVSVLLGDKWVEVVPLLKILSLSAVPLYMAHTASVTLDSMAQLKLSLRIQMAVLFLMVSLFVWFSSSLTLENISYIILSMAFFRFILMYGSVIKLLNMAKKELGLILIILMSIILSTALIMNLMLLMTAAIDLPIIRLLFDVIAGAMGLIVALFFSRYFLRQLHSVDYLRNQLPVFDKIMAI